MNGPIALVGRKHPTLTRRADFVGEPSDRHRRLAEQMRQTLSRARGLAIAAPQVGHSLQMIVTPSLVVCDPIVHTDGRLVTDVEGCLSLPGRWYEVERYDHATVVGLDLDCHRVELDVTGIDARMWQHERDHLYGVLISTLGPEIRPSRSHEGAH